MRSGFDFSEVENKSGSVILSDTESKEQRIGNLHVFVTAAGDTFMEKTEEKQNSP